jgi:pimeloyl-ACP methyl ester carboxylesterase
LLDRLPGKRALTQNDVHWTVDGLKMAGLMWGPPSGRRVLALHGWLDHAGSFMQLAPRLSGCRVLALDLTGHGHSDHRSPDATYAIWDDVPQILGVLDQAGWDDVALLGHSRGAMICLLLAALRPERFNAVVALDALMPAPLAEADVVAQLRLFLDDTARAKRGRQRRFAAAEEFIERREDRGHSPDVGRQLMARALAGDGDGFRVRADPRLHAGSSMKFTAGQIDAILAAITAPVLAIWARDGLSGRDWVQASRQRARELLRDFSEVELAGHHHWHLDKESAPLIAVEIGRFLAQDRDLAAE